MTLLIAYLALVAACFYASFALIAFFEWMAGSPVDCTCSRHRWDPACPRHGREAA